MVAMRAMDVMVVMVVVMSAIGTMHMRFVHRIVTPE